MKRKPFDHRLELKLIPVKFVSGSQAQARAEGNNAAWSCECGTLLVGRCYFQFGDTCYTECPECHRTYRVTPDERKRAIAVIESGLEVEHKRLKQGDEHAPEGAVGTGS